MLNFNHPSRISWRSPQNWHRCAIALSLPYPPVPPHEHYPSRIKSGLEVDRTDVRSPYLSPPRTDSSAY
ncbi:MAG: hypothetical protein GDA44_02670 [Prochloron sp. SP5CPC1]|nr:hypothetical protein [Candidatus Paraprochloron terpiosi SP5CPC1]